MPDCPRRKREALLLFEITPEPLCSISGLALDLDHLIFNLGWCPAGLMMWCSGTIFEIAFFLLPEDIVDHSAVDPEDLRPLRDVVAIALQILQHCSSGCLRIYPPQLLVVNPAYRL
jgi:hypothetical protein